MHTVTDGADGDHRHAEGGVGQGEDGEGHVGVEHPQRGVPGDAGAARQPRARIRVSTSCRMIGVLTGGVRKTSGGQLRMRSSLKWRVRAFGRVGKTGSKLEISPSLFNHHYGFQQP